MAILPAVAVWAVAMMMWCNISCPTSHVLLMLNISTALHPQVCIQITFFCPPKLSLLFSIDEKMSAVKANEQLESIWKAAQAKYEKTLSAKELKQIKSVSTKEALLDEAERLNRKYHSRKSARSLTRIHPVIAQIESFSAVIKTFIQADPGVTALVWGSIFFIIELATRHSKYLDEILSAFELFDRDIPRFHHYTGRYGLRQLKPSLTKALVHYYAGLIGICQDSIRFLRNHPLSHTPFHIQHPNMNF